jgi:capsular exopolysaccharide synthesis family protein
MPGQGHSLPHLEEIFDVRRLYFLILSHIVPVATFIILGMIIVGAILLRLPDIYESRAVLQVEQQEKKVLKTEKVTDETPANVDFVNTVVQALTSRNILLRVVKANHLEKNPTFAKPRSDGTPYTDNQLAILMEKKVKVKLRRLTRLIDITVEDTDPELACTLAKSMVKEFLREGFEQRLSVSHVADDYLKEEAAKLKEKLQKSEQELQAYKEKNNAVSLEQSQNIIIEKLRDVSASVTEAKNARLKLESDLEQLKAAGKVSTEDLLRINSVAALPEVASVREELLKAESDLSTLKERYMEKHPKYQAARNKVETLRGSLNTAASKAGDILARQYDSAKETESKLDQVLKEQEAKALELNKLSIPYNVLAREVETDRSLYESVVSRMKETGVASGVETAPYRVIEEPMIPSKPSAPKRLKILAIALILLTVSSVFWLMVRDSLSSTIRSVDQAESLLGLPVLGAIPDQKLTTVEVLASNFKKENRKTNSRNKSLGAVGKKDEQHYLIATVDDPGSILSESYRTLRASITLLGPKEQTKVLLFTSAIPDEGKTFSSINCAVTFAQQGEKTLIIDSDMRRPSLHHALLRGEERRGLTDFLSGQAKLDELIGETSVPGLSIMTSGRRAPNPAELLLQSDIPALIQELLGRFDRIIIDSAPVNAVSDTLYIAGPAKEVVLVVRSDKTPSKVVQRAITQLRKSGTHVAGIVLNRIRRGPGEGYYYYSYGDKYHKDSVYGSSQR